MLEAIIQEHLIGGKVLKAHVITQHPLGSAVIPETRMI